MLEELIFTAILRSALTIDFAIKLLSSDYFPIILASVGGSLAAIYLYREHQANRIHNRGRKSPEITQPIQENIHEKRLNAVGFKGEVPFNFRDPIYHSIMMNPVILYHNGQTFEKASIDEWIDSLKQQKQQLICPITRMPINFIEDKAYTINFVIKNTIEEWVNKIILDLEKEKENKLITELPRKEGMEKMLKWHSIFKHRHPKELLEKPIINNKYISKMI
ncbi:MAG: hypothetical protein JO149_10010 [Gammaproteobacteria bacterium]|nr:hypothetical protein [Gammaproteobacteria bacterium]